MAKLNNQNHQNAVCVLLLFLVMTLGCDAWVSVRGRVIDESGKPIAGAKIVVEQGDNKVAETFSERDCKFEVHENIAPGPLGSRMIKLQVSKDSYQPFEIKYDWSEKNEKFKNDYVVTLSPVQGNL